MDLGFFACYYFFIDSAVTYIMGKRRNFLRDRGRQVLGDTQVPVRSCELLIALNATLESGAGTVSLHTVCAGSSYLNQYQCFKNWQEHEDLEASLVARKPKWNIKYLKSRSDLINAFSSNPAFKLSHSIG